MTLEEEYEVRKMVLDAVAGEARRVIEATLQAGLAIGAGRVVIPSQDYEWHVNITCNAQQHFVSIDGHTHGYEPSPSPSSVPSIIEQMVGGGGGGNRMDFSFNCPLDWVPKVDSL